MKTTITQNQIFRTLSRLQRSCCSAVFLLLFLLSASSSWGQSIFTNPITGTNPNTANPYTTGQTVDPGITVSGIARGSGITSSSANNRYSATGWPTNGTLSATDYFEWTLTPTTCKEIDFVSFVYTSQLSATGGTFVFRSSLDNYTANIGTASSTGTTISLSAAVYQNITSAITFRLYAYGLSASSTSFSINDFTFNGSVNNYTPSAPTASAQTFCPGATVANLTATGASLKWYAASSGGSTLASTTTLSTTTYYVSQTINGCESTRTAVSVTVNLIPAPTASAQTFTIGATVADLVATGTALKWYDAASGGTALAASTLLSTGTDYVSQTVNGCESARTAVSVTVNTVIAQTNGQMLIGQPGTFIHTFPTFVKGFEVETWGAGGGGGGSSRASGGGGGAFAKSYLVNAGSSYSVTVGAGGAGGVSASAGVDGGNTIFGSSEVVAEGGKKGTNANSSGSSTGVGGLISNSTGTVKFAGGTGGLGRSGGSTGRGGGGGSSAGTASNGNDGGQGGGSVGTGGAAVTDGGAGGAGDSNGSNPGGGGGGSTSGSGGSGGNGQIRLTYVDISNLTIASDVTVCNNTTATITLNSTSLPAGTYSVSYTVANHTISSSASMTFASGTGTFTTATLSTAGAQTLTITRITLSSETGIYSEPAAALTGTITVNPLPTATISAVGDTEFCSGGSVVLNANTGTGLSYQWKLNGVNITDATASSYTATTAGAFTVTVTNANSCSATSAATTVNVNALPGSVTSANVTLCGTGSVTLTADNPGAGYTINWYNTAQDTQLATASLTYTTPSLSTTTTYYAEMENTTTGCKSQNRTAVQAIVNATNSYTGGVSGTNTDWFTAGNWSCGTVPNATTTVVIPTGKTVSIAYRPNEIAAAAYSVTLVGTASLTVTSDHNFNVTNKVTVASGASFTVQNNASLVQTDNVANEGVITVQKSTPSTRLLKRNDAVLWSSPVVQNLRAISTGTPDAYFMQHNPQANSWSAVSSPATADFTKGKGFLVRTPATFPTTATQQWNVTFTGVPNNGNVTISAGDTGNTEKYLLVGNPYPSAISIAAFRAANPNITGVFYFFRKPNGVTGISSYGTLSANNSFAPNDDAVGAVSPGEVIPSGQGFFVAMKSDNNNGNVVFTNEMRVANNHGAFNRMNTNLDTYKLTVQTPAGGNSQFITNYDSETTNGYDVGYDAVAFTDGTTDLSIIMNNEKYRIQSRGDYNSADVIPVQFKTGVAGEHRIKLQDAQGVFAANQMVIIKDNLTGVQHNLTANGDYVFTATAGTFTNRFEVIYQQAYYTALQANSCGSTIANMNSLVYADLVNGATGYRFKVVNNTTSAVQTIDRPQHWFAFNMLSAYDYNTPYTISVQVQKDGVWTGYYGATCTVNSPNIAAAGVMQINPSQCGMTLPTLGTVIATTPVAGATGYKFRITNTTAGAIGNNLVQEITRTNHWFSLGMLSRYNYGSSYAIEVAVKTTGGYTPYGNACTVYSPAVPTLATCGQTVATATTLVRTTAMNLATQYRLQVTRMSTQETITFDTANYWFSFRVNVPGYAAGEQYGVRVAVMTAGAWSPYGDACDITAPIATARTTEEAAPSEANLFKPVAYPNPFASTFGISLATPSADVIHVMVYDLQGRLIEKQNVFVSELDGLQIGTNYPSGDYLLVVAQGANIKSSHIHKD